MKIVALLLAGILSLTAVFGQTATEDDGPVRHVVAFKYKPDATAQEIARVTDAFRELQHSIPGILNFEHGINNSPEGLNDGFTHVYQVTFEDAEARDNYLPHPEHQKFGELLGELGILEEAFVIDYVVQE